MSQVEKLKNIPKGNLIGLIGSIIPFFTIAAAIAIQPGFSWSDNPLSDLGSWFRTDLGELQIVSAILFNGGLIISGLMVLYFTIWLIKQIGDTPSKGALSIFACTAILLAGIGIFSEDFHLGHILTALPFFLSIPIALGVIGIVWLRLSEMRILGTISIILCIISVLILFQAGATLSTAVFEILEAIVVMGWVWIVNYSHYSGRLSSILSTEVAQ